MRKISFIKHVNRNEIGFVIAVALLITFGNVETKADEVTIDSLTYELVTPSDSIESYMFSNRSNMYPYASYPYGVLIGCKKKGIVGVPAYVGQYVVQYEDGAFRGNNDITSVVLPKYMLSISGFSKCYNLKSVVLPESIKEIPEWGFYQTWSLRALNIPEGVETIGSYAFDESGITQVTLPSTLQEIGFGAFRNCRNLQSIEVPASVQVLDLCAFHGCEGMTSAKILCPLKVLPDNTFFNARKLESVELPNTIETIGNSAFWSCDSLKTFHFPENVKIIEANAFAGSGIEVLELPASIDSIGERAFESMRAFNLRLIKVYAKVPPKAYGDNVFTNYNNTDWRTYQEVPLEVPAESVEAYRKAPVWRNFANIVPLDTYASLHSPETQEGTLDYYTIDGMRTNRVGHGVIIVRKSNGEVRKVLH